MNPCVEAHHLSKHDTEVFVLNELGDRRVVIAHVGVGVIVGILCACTDGDILALGIAYAASGPTSSSAFSTSLTSSAWGVISAAALRNGCNQPAPARGSARRSGARLGGLIPQRDFQPRLTSQKIQQLRLCGLFLHGFRRLRVQPAASLLQALRLPLHGSDASLAGLGGPLPSKLPVPSGSGPSRLAALIMSGTSALRLFLSQLCLLRIQNSLLGSTLLSTVVV